MINGCDVLMTPTKELRKGLDELGVEWEEGESYGANAVTIFKSNGIPLRYVEYDDYCWLDYHENAPLIPAQAIAATVGAGTCHMEVKDNMAEAEGMGYVWLECDQCNWQMPLGPTTPKFSFCPHCGRRIEVSK